LSKPTTVIRPSSGIVTLEVTCRGVSPLLMNKIDDATLLNLRKPGGKKAKTRERPELPRDEAVGKVYTTRDGKPYIPTENLLACLIAAGQFVRLDGKRQVSTAKSTTLPAFLSLEDQQLELYVHPERVAPDWETDIRPGRNPNGGEMVCLVRPRFDAWAFDVTCTVDLDEISMAIVRQLFDAAGKRIGLGDFRPSRKGPFGKFNVVRWEESTYSASEAAE
jgi:hypothetical protein